MVKRKPRVLNLNHRRLRSGAKAKANKALKEVKALKKMVNSTIENKQINNKLTSTAVTSSWHSASGFFGLIQGTSDGNLPGSSARIGNSVTLMRSQFKFNFDIEQSTASHNKVRLIICQSDDGSQSLLPSDILQYSNYTTDGDLVFASPYTTKTTTNKRYKILLDRVFTLNKYSNASKQINFVKRYGKSGKVVNWNGNSSSSPTDFKTTIMAISDSTVAPDPHYEYSLRHTYKDA